MTAGRSAGFTLVEMLAAIVLLSLMLGAFGSLLLRLERTNAAIAGMERAENVDVVRRFLQRSLEQCRALPRVNAAGERRIRFLGEAARIACTEVSGDTPGTGGVLETAIWLDADGRLLLLRRSADAPAGAATRPEVLLADVASLRLSYAPCPEGGAVKPVARWTATDRLPHRISVSLAFRAGDVRRWRELSAFIPAAGCLLGE